jgi:sarcosine oxidase subunit beta
MTKPDVLVVGAGVVGCAIACHLARAGSTVTVFDKGPVCAGMSARSGALLRMHYTFAPEAELAWKSLAYFAGWREMIGGECGFVRTGFALVADSANAEKLRANVAMLRQIGIDTDIADAQTLRELAPAFNTADVALAAYEPRSGYADPLATTRSLTDAAMKHGATFRTHAPVAEIITRGGRAAGVRLADGHVAEADAVCIAAGPWTDRLLAPMGTSIGIRAERAQIAFFRRAPAMRHPACVDLISGSYFRPHGDGLTLAGLGQWRPEGEPDPDRFQEENDPEFIAEAGRRLAHRIPAMNGAPRSHGHAGIYDVSPDARAVLGGVPGIERLYVSAGFSGTGFKTAPAVGAAMAELILEGRSRSVDISPFSFQRIVDGNLIRTANEYRIGGNFGHTI